MIASAIIQTVLLLSSGAFNAVLNPGSLSVEKQLFVSSVILIIGAAQGLCLLLIKVVLRAFCGCDVKFGISYLFAPLTTALRIGVNDRPGETDPTIPVVLKATPRLYHNPVPDIESDEEEAPLSHFNPEQELVLEERRHVYSDIYLLGIAAFTTTYCIDTVSPTPTTAFISGLLVMSVTQAVNILFILSRSNAQDVLNEVETALHGKRLLTVISCMFATASFIMFCIGLAGTATEVSVVENMFDVTFSVALPLVCPWLLVTVSPKQAPMRTLMECTPFVLTLCLAYIMFFLATRGQIFAIVHALGNIETNSSLLDITSVTDLEFHSDVNASIHFATDFSSTTSVDSAANIPLLLCAPILKIPAIIVVLANVINRSNLILVTSLLLVMTARQISDTSSDLPAYRAYCVTMGLSLFALLFNVAKYTSIPASLFKRPLSDEEVPNSTPPIEVHIKDPNVNPHLNETNSSTLPDNARAL